MTIIMMKAKEKNPTVIHPVRLQAPAAGCQNPVFFFPDLLLGIRITVSGWTTVARPSPNLAGGPVVSGEMGPSTGFLSGFLTLGMNGAIVMLAPPPVWSVDECRGCN